MTLLTHRIGGVDRVVVMTLVIAQYGQGGPDVLRAENRDLAAPGATQVEVEQKAIGFNYFDALQRRGFISQDEPGRVMGIEGAGVVTAIGAGVTDFAVGDRVGYLRSQGAYAATRLIEADLLFPLPQDIGFEAAAALTVKGFTAWLCAVRLFDVQPGQTVLVTTAAGGVGSLTARLATYRGARVIGVVGSEAKRALAHDNGAVEVAIGLDDAIDLVARLTEGNGVDVVFDGIGADTADRLLDVGSVRSGGTIISFGASGGWPKADPDAVARRGATVVAPQVPNYIKTAAELRAGMAEVFALYRDGGFGEISPARYPLRDAAALHAHVESRTASGISVLVP
ncbi:zinc-binding dehydrogenase [Sphingomonas xinjiangensis]|uniref:NADPH2:quinone reductase n=1 Tax=Sphingomonas xinjiangensis TaxID=643568 RepID=A0A840YT91_9SPHN|nr:zinc-binding dehydrogenase [Sphingomonas xinjiangensis]MBB5712929.1 NADPH2:quinone reductase [Sphingomonas xinjiangensis]